MEYLLSKGAQIDSKFQSGATPLVIASQKGFYQIVKLLLSKGANIHAVGANRENSLHVAYQGGFVDIVKLLLSSGSQGLYRGIRQ